MKKVEKRKNCFVRLMPVIVTGCILCLMEINYRRKYDSEQLLMRVLPVIETSKDIAIDIAPEVHACSENPYEKSLLPGHSFDSTHRKAQAWLSNKTSIYNTIQSKSNGHHTHDRFDAFEVMSPCNYTCTGPCRADDSKIVCGVETLEHGCIIYSIGGNNNWVFEENIYDMTPCEIHTFDCTGPEERFQPPVRIQDRHFFHHICLSSENKPPVQHPESVRHGKRVYGVVGEMMTLETIQKKLLHSRLDLLKLDIEGFEWPIFESWSELPSTTSGMEESDALSHSEINRNQETAKQITLPMQILVEVHYRTHVEGLWTKRGNDFKKEKDIVNFQEHLLKMGYSVAVRDDNRACRHCTELTLLRHQCQ